MSNMSFLDHGTGPTYHHGKSQWFVKGGVPGGSSGSGFVYGSNVPPGYDISKGSYTKEPQKIDPAMMSGNGAEPVNRAHHLQNYHLKEFQPAVDATYDPVGDQVKKTQHFIRGQIPGGSGSNKMIYGKNEQLNKVNPTEVNSQQEKPTGFMYGTEAATKVGQAVAGSKPNGALWIEERNQTDKYKSNLKKLQSERDDFLTRHYEEKAKQRLSEIEEKRKDYQMLLTHEPWGKPGGGAPRFRGKNSVDTRVSKNADTLLNEHYEPLAIGGPGGGAPNRTVSGNFQTRLREDRELQFPLYGPKAYTEPNLRYGARARGEAKYGKELDNIVEDTRTRKMMERQRSFEEEYAHINHDPFGRPGGGAPRKDEKGNLKTGIPLTLSKDSEELRGIEPRHSHAYNHTFEAQENPELDPRKYKEKVTIYDPWGKGTGAPLRNETGRLKRQVRPQNDDLDGLGIPVGTQGAGAPVKDADGNLKTKKNQTLVRDKRGQLYPREFSPKGYSMYNPWGKPGAGAPITDNQGKMVTQTAGKVHQDTMAHSPVAKMEVEAKQQYLKTLQNMTEQERTKKRLEHEDQLNSGKDVASWLKSGVVGQPKYNPLTKEIVSNPKGTSDVTLQKLHIVRHKNEQSRAYHQDLEALAEERFQQRRRDKETDQRDGVSHVETMNSVWGRPGAGAPLKVENVAAARRQKVGIESADSRYTFREV